jgi:hypothetical protein
MSYEEWGIRDWFALSGRRLHHYTVDNPSLRAHLPGGWVLFFYLIFKGFSAFDIYCRHSLRVRFLPYFSPKFSVLPLILRFVRTWSDSRPEGYILIYQGLAPNQHFGRLC